MGGTRADSAPSATSILVPSRLPKRICSTATKPAQRDLRRERDLLLVRQGEGLPEELRELDRHRARRRAVCRRQRADRVQAVEQEVRIDLRAQHLQLGVAREEPRLRVPLLRGADILDADQHVVRHDREQVQRHAAGEEHGRSGSGSATPIPRPRRAGWRSTPRRFPATPGPRAARRRRTRQRRQPPSVAPGAGNGRRSRRRAR
jgi:hypothetical protein